MEYTKGPNTITLARGGSKKLEFPIHGKDPEIVCGKVIIDISVPKPDGGTTIGFSWAPNKEAKCDLCPPDGAMGWIPQDGIVTFIGGEDLKIDPSK